MCDREREYEDSSYWRQKGFHGYLATKHPTKWCMCPTHDWNAKNQDKWRQLCFKSILWVRPSHETFYSANLYYLIHIFYTHTIYTHITHNCWGVLLRENPSLKPWELEIIIPIYLCTYACGFPQLLLLHFHTIKRLIAQTLTTPFQSVK